MALIGELGQVAPPEQLHPLVRAALSSHVHALTAPHARMPALAPPAHLQVQNHMPAVQAPNAPTPAFTESVQQPNVPGLSHMENQAVNQYSNRLLKQMKKQARSFGFQGNGMPVGAKAPMADNRIVGLAREYLGTPYVWGGNSPKGFDCSGFAQFIYGKVGINIPRTTYTQWTAKNGRAVSKRNLQPGDLVFFRGSDSVGGLPGHVGVYIGGGKMIDEAHTGTVARIESVWNFGGYMGARRYHR